MNNSFRRIQRDRQSNMRVSFADDCQSSFLSSAGHLIASSVSRYVNESGADKCTIDRRCDEIAIWSVQTTAIDILSEVEARQARDEFASIISSVEISG